MAMPKGRSGNPAGRPKGSKNKTTLSKEQTLSELIKDRRTPLEFLLSVMEMVRMPITLRIDAAKAAAPYIHKRQPIMVEGPGPGGSHVIRGGVMMVPVPQTDIEWEKRCAASQERLKLEVRGEHEQD